MVNGTIIFYERKISMDYFVEEIEIKLTQLSHQLIDDNWVHRTTDGRFTCQHTKCEPSLPFEPVRNNCNCGSKGYA